MKKQLPRIAAFYSYKGGVGRSLALANTGVALAAKGFKVLLIDLDLEAPGLHDIYPFRDVGSPAEHGLLELLSLYLFSGDSSAQKIELESFPMWQLETYATPVWRPENALNESKSGEVWLMPASGTVWSNKQSEKITPSLGYGEVLASFDWSRFYAEAGDPAWVNLLDRVTKEKGGYGFDFVLLDSRTGLSDPFYIALSLASDIVAVSGFNRQNIKGIRDIVNQTKEPEFIAEYGHKRIHLVGSPAPDMDQEQWTRWEDELKAFHVWSDFPGFHVRLPYFKEFALDERVVVENGDTNTSIQQRDYARNIGLLAQTLELAGNQGKSNKPMEIPEPTNPFALLRADYASIEELGHYFIDPGQELVRAMKTFKPVVMAGARGCGKTMLGRYFSFEREAMELSEKGVPASPTSAPDYLGLYLRIDIDLLQIFNPPSEEQRALYNSLFGQFFDLLVFRKALDALDEFGGITSWCVSKDAEENIYKTLLREFGPRGQGVAADNKSMHGLIKDMLAEMRLYVNNPRTSPEPFKLQSNILLKLLVEELISYGRHHFEKHYFAVIVDEYEHFSEAQQKVVNSRIKQIKQSDHTTYRIFVKHGKAGLHTTATLAENQQIQPIHDFNLINLDEDTDAEEFSAQQHRIAERHLTLNPFFNHFGIRTLEDMLATESANDQARRIAGDDKKLRDFVQKNYSNRLSAILNWFDEEPRLLTKAVAVVIMNQGKRGSLHSQYSAKEGKSPENVIAEFKEKTAKSKDWLHNYERGTLFWLANLHAKPKNLVYAGSDMVITLAGRNVRTFLELCRAIVEEWFANRTDEALAAPPISVAIQTTALKRAAENYRGVIRSLPMHSRELLNLADRLGQIFSVLAKSSTQSEPEINHFSIVRDSGNAPWFEYFQTAYAESILLRLKGNKQKSDTDLQQDDWQLNPCFAPHYVFSPRRKKKLGTLSGSQMSALLLGEESEFKKLLNYYKARLGADALDANQVSLFTSSNRK
jgi:CobQ/CobB/MinD/ParA nucleotide binding domain